MKTTEKAPGIFDELNETQKQLLGWFAGIVAAKDHAIYEEKHAVMASQWHEMMKSKIASFESEIDVLESACVMCGISEAQIIRVKKDKYFVGLRNHNKLSYIAYYE